jgi:glycosyltransferase involved in cell wall biosynthesis
VVLDPAVLDERVTDQQFWANKAVEIGWKKPEWLGYATERGRQVALRSPGLALKTLARAGVSFGAVKFALASLHLVGPLSEFDFLILLGTGPVFGYLAGVPYIVIPYGADITWLPFQSGPLAHIQRRAYARAHRILIGDWRFVDSLARLGLSDRWTYFPFPIDPESCADDATDARVMASKLWPSWTKDKFVFFAPSAQDFQTKGTDKVLRAFLRLCHERDDVALVTPTWGTDKERAMDMVAQAKGKDTVAFLPYVVSRPLLKAFYRASNVVVGEFASGSYGLSVLEAMVCERPVISHVDPEKYLSHMRRFPPVLQAQTEGEIYEKMKWAVENPEASRMVGRESRRWVANEHWLSSLNMLDKTVSDGYGSR